MEGLLEALGIVGLLILLAIGALAGLIASLVAGGDRVKYVIVGILAAVAAPVLLAIVGIGIIAAYGIAAILIAAVIGAIIVLLVVNLVSGNRTDRRP